MSILIVKYNIKFYMGVLFVGTYIAVACFILFDIITGIIKALYNEGLNSTYLRKGLFHKLSEVIAIIGSGLLEYGMNYIELGVELPVLNVVAIYICSMELVSILENLGEVNPALGKLFKPYLEKLKGDNNDGVKHA